MTRPVWREPGARLEQGVLVERRPRLGDIGVGRDVVQADHLQVGHLGGEDAAQLAELLGVAGRQQERSSPEQGLLLELRPTAGSRTTARSSSASSSSRRNGTPSAVPCTSTNSPAPVTTTFMSVSARTSSSYIRSRRGSPSMSPTDTAAIESISGLGWASAPARGAARRPRRDSATIRAGDRSGARAAVGLQHVAVDRDRVLAERGQIDGSAQRAADQPRDLVGAPADPALAPTHGRCGSAWRAAASSTRR